MATPGATNKPATITREYEGMTFVFREDGYFNMTKAALAFERRLDNFKLLDTTKDYIEALALALKISVKAVMEVTRGNGLLPT